MPSNSPLTQHCRKKFDDLKMADEGEFEVKHVHQNGGRLVNWCSELLDATCKNTNMEYNKQNRDVTSPPRLVDDTTISSSSPTNCRMNCPSKFTVVPVSVKKTKRFTVTKPSTDFPPKIERSISPAVIHVPMERLGGVFVYGDVTDKLTDDTCSAGGALDEKNFIDLEPPCTNCDQSSNEVLLVIKTMNHNGEADPLRVTDVMTSDRTSADLIPTDQELEHKLAGETSTSWKTGSESAVCETLASDRNVFKYANAATLSHTDTISSPVLLPSITCEYSDRLLHNGSMDEECNQLPGTPVLITVDKCESVEASPKSPVSNIFFSASTASASDYIDLLTPAYTDSSKLSGQFGPGVHRELLRPALKVSGTDSIGLAESPSREKKQVTIETTAEIIFLKSDVFKNLNSVLDVDEVSKETASSNVLPSDVRRLDATISEQTIIERCSGMLRIKCLVNEIINVCIFFIMIIYSFKNHRFGSLVRSLNYH